MSYDVDLSTEVLLYIIIWEILLGLFSIINLYDDWQWWTSLPSTIVARVLHPPINKFLVLSPPRHRLPPVKMITVTSFVQIRRVQPEIYGWKQPKDTSVWSKMRAAECVGRPQQATTTMKKKGRATNFSKGCRKGRPVKRRRVQSNRARPRARER